MVISEAAAAGALCRLCSSTQGSHQRGSRCIRPGARGNGRFLRRLAKHCSHLCGTEAVRCSHSDGMSISVLCYISIICGSVLQA